MFELLLGHLVGDYLLQNNWMALGKSKHNGLGWLTCTAHCLFYTVAVCSLMWLWDLKWVIAVFLSHFVIDKFGFPEWYCKTIKGRSIGSFLADADNSSYTPHVALRAGFNTFVYVVVDNTMHLLLMYMAWRYFYS